MSDKVNLNTVTTFTNDSSAAATINENNALVTAAFDNTLSRDGTIPNQMLSNLDMNSNRILNLPPPASPNEPLRLADNLMGVVGPAGPTGPPGPSNLPTNNTWTGSNYFKTGYPVVDAKAWGALGDGTTNDTVAIQNAINYAQTLFSLTSINSATVYLSPGHYIVSGGLTITGAGINLQGAGRNATFLSCNNVAVTVLTLGNTGNCKISDLSIFGIGQGSGSAGFNSTISHGILVDYGAVNNIFENIDIYGGFYCLLIHGSDNTFRNVTCEWCYGFSQCYNIGSSVSGPGNWFERCKFDLDTPIPNQVLSGFPSAWAATTSYSLGTLVTVSYLSNAYVIQCTVAGTSDSFTPVPKNVGQNITDGTATWRFCFIVNYASLVIDSYSTQSNFVDCDFTTNGYNAFYMNDSIAISGSVPTYVSFLNCDFGGGIGYSINLAAGEYVLCTNCVIGGTSLTSGVAVYSAASGAFVGNSSFVGNTIFSVAYGFDIQSGNSIVISNNVFVNITSIGVLLANATGVMKGIVVTGNVLSGGATGHSFQTIGTMNNYIIANNSIWQCTSISDGATGTTKTVTGNV